MPAFRKSLVSFLKNIGWLSKKRKKQKEFVGMMTKLVFFWTLNYYHDFISREENSIPNLIFGDKAKGIGTKECHRLQKKNELGKLPHQCKEKCWNCYANQTYCLERKIKTIKLRHENITAKLKKRKKKNLSPCISHTHKRLSGYETSQINGKLIITHVTSANY